MLTFLGTQPYQPFTTALTIIVIIAIAEGLGTVFNISISEYLDGVFSNKDADINTDYIPSDLSRSLEWLYIKQAPTLILLVILLACFGLTGILIQRVSQYVIHLTLPTSLVSIPALFLSLFSLRIFGGYFSRVTLDDNTKEVNSNSFIGRTAVITSGTARYNSSAQAKLVDKYNQTHYITVEPYDPADVFPSGTDVLLVKQKETNFYVIENIFETLK